MVSKLPRTTANQLCCLYLARSAPVSESGGYCPYPTTRITVVALFLLLHSLVSSVIDSSAVSHTESAYKFSFLQMGNTPRKPTHWFPKIRQPNHRKNFGRLFIRIVYGKTMAVSQNSVLHQRTIFCANAFLSARLTTIQEFQLQRLHYIAPVRHFVL